MKKLTMVMTSTSRLRTWLSSWATTPSSSEGGRRCMIPVVTHTTAPLRERPRAKALGKGLSATATRGLGMSDWKQSRSTIAWSSGAC